METNTFEQPAPAEVASDVHERPAVEFTQEDARGVRLAQGLGWFSIGLGITELLMPRMLGKVIGLRGGSTLLMRLSGIRDIVSGAVLLSGRAPVRAMEARLLGDLLDLGALGVGMFRSDAKGRVATAAASVIGAAGLDFLARHHLAKDPQRAERVGKVTRIGKAVTIEAEPPELYSFWRKLEHLPAVMPHLHQVERLDSVRSRWSAKGPAGAMLTWEAEIVDDIPNKLIAWTTIGGPLESGGVVRFLPAPGGRGTEVVVEMQYHVLGGGLGRAAATVMGLEPGVELERGLRRLKQMFEIGEIMSADRYQEEK